MTNIDDILFTKYNLDSVGVIVIKKLMDNKNIDLKLENSDIKCTRNGHNFKPYFIRHIEFLQMIQKGDINVDTNRLDDEICLFARIHTLYTKEKTNYLENRIQILEKILQQK